MLLYHIILPPSTNHPQLACCGVLSLRSRVRIHLPLAAGHGDVDEAAGVRDALLRPALGRLLLLLWFDLPQSSFISTSLGVHLSICVVICYLWSLRLDFARTGEGAVDFAHDCGLDVGGCSVGLA